MYKPFIKTVWKGVLITPPGIGDLRSPWLITTYKVMGAHSASRWVVSIIFCSCLESNKTTKRWSCNWNGRYNTISLMRFQLYAPCCDPEQLGTRSNQVGEFKYTKGSKKNTSERIIMIHQDLIFFQVGTGTFPRGEVVGGATMKGWRCQGMWT